MRAFVSSFLLALALVVTPPAHAQRPPPTELLTFQEKTELEKKPSLGPEAYLFLGILGCVIFLGLLVWFRKQARDLGLPEDEAELAAQGIASGRATGLSPKESIYTALGRVGGWATVGRISMATGVESSTTEDLLRDLVEEGRVKAGRDKRGRVLYRTV